MSEIAQVLPPKLSRETRWKNFRSSGLAMLVASLPVIFIAIFVGIPAVMAIAFSLGYTEGPNTIISLLDQQPAQGWTLKVYQDLFKDHSFQTNLWSTIWVTVVSVVMILAVGWGLALYLRFDRSRFVNIISSLYLVPMFIPVVIAAYAIVTFWNSHGFLSTLFVNVLHLPFEGLTNSLFSIVLGQLWVNIPFSVLMLASGLRNVPDSLIEAARDAGASFPRILWRILVPLNMLPTIIVATFTGIGIMGSFTVPYLTGPTAPNMLGVNMANYFRAYGRPQQATAMAVIVFIMAAGLGAVYVWANVRGNRRAGGGR